MNREAEIERCARDVLQMAEYGQIDSCTFKGNQVMEALRQALELPKQEPQHHIVDSNKMIGESDHIPDTGKKVYVPMSKEEHLAIAMQCMGADNWQQETMKAVEVEVVRRMKEQGLV